MNYSKNKSPIAKKKINIPLKMILNYSLIKCFLHILNLKKKLVKQIFIGRRFSLLWTDSFNGRGYKVAHLSEKCNRTVSSIEHMTYEFYIKRPKCKWLIELKFDT